MTKKRKVRALIDHPLLEPFEPRLKALLEWGFDGGIRALKDAGYELGDDLVDDKANECFKKGLFSSFADTQSAVGVLLVELEEKRRELLKEAKLLRASRSASLSNIEEQLEAIENRQTILRRLMDGILWVLLSKPWIMRALARNEYAEHPDPDELKKLLSIAHDLNKKAEREIHLVSDLTTTCQIGDLIRIRWDENGAYMRLQEIKTGRINDRLGDLIESQGGNLSEEDLAKIESELGCDAKEQAERMVRQRERFQKFTDGFQAKPVPIDTSDTELLEALTVAKPPAVLTYLTDLPDLVSRAKDPANKYGMSYLGLDGCLWLMAVSEKGLDYAGGHERLSHYLFHAKRPGRDCTRDEIESLKKEPPLINLAVHNMTHITSRSPLIWYPKDLVLDVVMGRILICAQFDIEAFFRLAAESDIELSLITGKEAEEGKRLYGASPMLENPKAYGVRARFSNGRVMRLRSSFFRTVYSGLIYPHGLLNYIIDLDRIQGSVSKSS